jgi:hypothetical protein
MTLQETPLGMWKVNLLFPVAIPTVRLSKAKRSIGKVCLRFPIVVPTVMLSNAKRRYVTAYITNPMNFCRALQ